jgi:hypothetical protein
VVSVPFWIGRHDTPYKLGTVKLDIFGDTIADYNGGANNGAALDGVALIDMPVTMHRATATPWLTSPRPSAASMSAPPL